MEVTALSFDLGPEELATEIFMASAISDRS
jgi:hypothetical protein